MTAGISRRHWLAGAAASMAAWPGRGIASTEFPQRAVRLVVPYSVGVGPDVVARAVAERLSLAWRQPVVIDNKPGASGIIAFGDVRRTPADGHTLYVADTATMAINPLMHDALPYDPQRDLEPLSLLFRATFVILAGADNRLRSVADLLAAARSRPGGVSYASLGHGHASQVAVETFARAAGIRLLHVPFKDAGALFTAVAQGEVDFTVFSLNTVAGLVTAGKLRPLAVAARQRLASHPALPTVAEAGGPPTEMHPWAALVTVAGTPAPVLSRLQNDVVAALSSPEVRARAEQSGFEITPSTPQALRDRVAADRALYAPLVEDGRLVRP